MNDSRGLQRVTSGLFGLVMAGVVATSFLGMLIPPRILQAWPFDDHPGGFSQADRLDLQADVDGSGSITGLDEHCEETSGVLVLLNRDDDNGNGVWDYLETGYVAGEDDLVQIMISPSDLASGGLWLSGLGGSLRVWTSADKSTGTEIVATQGDYHLWDLDTSPTYPATLYVEGIAASSVARDKELILHWNGYIFDTINFSVLEVDLDMDSNLDGTVDDNDNTAGEDEDIEESLSRGLGAVIGFDGPAQAMKWQILPSDVTGDAMSIYEKNGQNDAVKVYEDSSLMDELQLPASWPYPWSSGPASTLYVVGMRPSEEVSDLELVLAIQRGQSSLTDTVRATVVQCDLDIDANYDGEIDDEDWLTTGDDALEFTSGGLVALGSTTTLKLDLTPHGIVDYGLTTATLSCLAGADHFTLYTSPTCESASSITLPMTWDQSTPATAMPAQLYFRGDSVSNYREVRLKLSATNYQWGASPDFRTFSDEIAMTVFGVTEILVKPVDEPQSAFRDRCTICVGGYDSDIHKAYVRLQISPAIAGVPVTVSMSGTKGSSGPHRRDAILTSSYGTTTETLTGVTSGTLHTDALGQINAVYLSSNYKDNAIIESGNESAEIKQEWVRNRWTYDPYVNYEEYTTMTVRLTQFDQPMDLHMTEFQVDQVGVFTWNPVYQCYVYNIFSRDSYDLSGLAYYCDDDTGGGDGIVTDSQNPGDYTAYLYVVDRCAEGIYTAYIRFSAWDNECKGPSGD